jgi:hypothetical protein
MLPVTGQLPASKTHATRRWTFIASDDRTQPGLGTVTLVQGRRDVDSYAVDTVDGEVLFCRLDDSSEVYGVQLNRVGQPIKCSCKGFSCKKTCKHVDAARELIADGIICTRPAVAA